ncbi:MAG: hypothetical protein ACLUPF_12320 [Dorea sp.]
MNRLMTVKDISNEVIYMTGVDPETYKTTTDYTYKSGGEDICTKFR